MKCVNTHDNKHENIVGESVDTGCLKIQCNCLATKSPFCYKNLRNVEVIMATFENCLLVCCKPQQSFD